MSTTAQLILFGYVAFGVVTAIIADRKNRNVIGWGILGFLFGVFALVICAVLPRRQPSGMY